MTLISKEILIINMQLTRIINAHITIDKCVDIVTSTLVHRIKIFDYAEKLIFMVIKITFNK